MDNHEEELNKNEVNEVIEVIDTNWRRLRSITSLVALDCKKSGDYQIDEYY